MACSHRKHGLRVGLFTLKMPSHLQVTCAVERAADSERLIWNLKEAVIAYSRHYSNIFEQLRCTRSEYPNTNSHDPCVELFTNHGRSQ